MALHVDSIIEGVTAGVVASVLLGAFTLVQNLVRNVSLRAKIHRSLRLVGCGTSFPGVTISLKNWAGTNIIIREVIMTTDATDYLLNPTGKVSSSFPSQYPRLTRAEKKKLEAGEKIEMPQQRAFITWSTPLPLSGFATLAPFTDQTFLLPGALLKDFTAKISGIRIVVEYVSITKRTHIVKKTVQSVAAPLQKTIEQFKTWQDSQKGK